jgi:quercetin dioxygenase-like cupin family protein
MKIQGYIKLISSADTSKESVLEMNILPSEKTPWHYHTLFAETFEILKGTLKVGKGKDVHQLNQGDIVTIQPNEKHYYHNVSNEECIVKVTLSPCNKNFENSLFILKGLAKDGLASVSGTPKKFSDLALFVYLNNSRIVGFQKIAEPIFNYVAKAAIKKGRLNELIQKYCKETI